MRRVIWVVLVGMVVVLGIVVFWYRGGWGGGGERLEPKCLRGVCGRVEKEQGEKEVKRMKISSPVLREGEVIPKKYTCDGEDVSLPFAIEGVSEGVVSLVLIVDDPDAPAGTWTHWLVWNIDPRVKEFGEGVVPEGGVQGKNDFGRLEYGGPCPPSGVHRYYWRVYGLDGRLELREGAGRTELERAMEGLVVDKGELMGRYGRS